MLLEKVRNHAALTFTGVGKAIDRNDLYRGQFVLARSIGKCISEITQLVCSLISVVDNIHEKWINDGKTSSRRSSVESLRVIKKKRRLSLMIKQNRHQTV